MWLDYAPVLWQAITIWCAVPAFHDFNRTTLLRSALFVPFGQATAAGRWAGTVSQGYKKCMAQAEVKCGLSGRADILQLQNPRPCFWALCCMAVLQGAEATEIGNNAVQCNMMQQAAVSLNPGVFISFVGRVSLWGSWKFGRVCLECIEWVLHTSEGKT